MEAGGEDEPQMTIIAPGWQRWVGSRWETCKSRALDLRGRWTFENVPFRLFLLAEFLLPLTILLKAQVFPFNMHNLVLVFSLELVAAFG